MFGRAKNGARQDAGNLNVDVDGALEKACRVFGVCKLFPQQKRAKKAFIFRKYVLVNLSTGLASHSYFRSLRKFTRAFPNSTTLLLRSQ